LIFYLEHKLDEGQFNAHLEIHQPNESHPKQPKATALILKHAHHRLYL